MPLFFFLSGCIDFYDKETRYEKYFLKKLKGILVPFWCFALLSVAEAAVLQQIGLVGIWQCIILIAKGCIRNTFFAGALWFFSCLFIMQLMFKLLKSSKKFVRSSGLHSVILIVICAFCFFASETLMQPRPIAEPSGIYNYDSAIYYIIYYAIGYVAYPHILSLFKLDTTKKRRYLFFLVSRACFTHCFFSTMLTISRSLFAKSLYLRCSPRLLKH